MKHIVIFSTCCLLFFTLHLSAQNAVNPIDADTKLITYVKVVEQPGLAKKDLFDRALAWVNSYYKNPADVLRENDGHAGKLVCKARFKLMSEPDKNGFQKDDGNVQYTLTIEAKEGKYRYKLTEINWKQPSYFPAERWMDTKNQNYSKTWEWYLKFTDEQVKKIVSDLEKYMLQPPKAKKDDW
jgi:hypothetical protein